MNTTQTIEADYHVSAGRTVFVTKAQSVKHARERVAFALGVKVSSYLRHIAKPTASDMLVAERIGHRESIHAMLRDW